MELNNSCTYFVGLLAHYLHGLKFDKNVRQNVRQMLDKCSTNVRQMFDNKLFNLHHSTSHDNWVRTFVLLIVTMIFLLRSELHSFPKAFVLSSVSRLAPTIPSERLTHRKVTINTDQTGGV